MILFYEKTNTDNYTKGNQATSRIIEEKKNIYLWNIFDCARKLIIKRIYRDYWLSLSFYLFILLSQCTQLFVKIFYILSRYLSQKKTKCYLKFLRNQARFTKIFKSLVLISFLSSLETISTLSQNSSGHNKSLNCENTLEQKLFYDENLFKEIKMNETLINLYKSCYKDVFQEFKSSHVLFPNPGQKECYINQIEPHHILYELIFNKKKNLIPQTVLDRIDLVCNKNQLNDLDRAFFLIEYEHPICGNIFKNSVKNLHLKNYIFKENNNKLKRSNYMNSASNRHHHNRFRDFRQVMSLKSYSIANSSDQSKTNEADEPKANYLNSDTEIPHLNNCSLILLNIYLLSNSASCSFDDFTKSLNHFDCLSNYFSVNSNCNKCQEAYKKWLCSSIIPYYYQNDELAKPCQRYCYTVENMCPFFRPMDSYGGQPVFHCRNVLQVMESRPDGYEDDDENYIEQDNFDDDRCFGECNETNEKKIQIDTDLNLIIKKKMSSLINSNTNFIQNLSIDSMFDIWIKLKTSQHPNANHFLTNKIDFSSGFNSKGRFNNVDECLFGFQPVISSSGQFLKYNSCFIFLLFYDLIFIFL